MQRSDRGTSQSTPGLAGRLGGWAVDLWGFWLGTAPRRVWLLTLLSVLWLSVFANQWLRIDREIAGAREAVTVSSEVAYVPPVEALRMASLGHQSFVADLLFVRVAHYFVRHLITDSRLPWLDLYLDAIWGLDAHNLTTYRWAAQVVKFGQRIDTDVARRANRFARLGLEYFPNDPWLYHEIAFNLHSHMATEDELERTRLDALALQYLSIAYTIPGFSYDPNYLAHQYARAGRVDDAVTAALATYAQATEEQRRQLRLRLAERDKAATAGQLAWIDRFRLRDWDYVPEGLALLLGPARVLAPPLTPWTPENWLAEPPTPERVYQRLGSRAVTPLPGRLEPAGREDPAGLPLREGAPGLALPRPLTPGVLDGSPPSLVPESK